MIITEQDKKTLQAVSTLSEDGFFIGKMNQIGKQIYYQQEAASINYTHKVRTVLYRMNKHGLIELAKVKQNFYVKLTDRGQETLLAFYPDKH